MNIPLRPRVRQRSLIGNGIVATMTWEGARAGVSGRSATALAKAGVEGLCLDGADAAGDLA
ncbi:MAG: hypothetical protein AAFR52_15060, partial [Pseudomonadota bacterium]